LNELWLDRPIEILIANPSKLHFGQEVFHCDLKVLDYEVGDMHTPYPNIEEDTKFSKVLIIKQITKSLCLNYSLSNLIRIFVTRGVTIIFLSPWYSHISITSLKAGQSFLCFSRKAQSIHCIGTARVCLLS
jgi:hypothetical protein